jgi:hypothetical protein
MSFSFNYIAFVDAVPFRASSGDLILRAFAAEFGCLPRCLPIDESLPGPNRLDVRSTDS